MWRPSQLPERRDDGEGGDGVGTDGLVSNEDCVDVRKLWVWIHASSFSEGYAALKLACQKQVDFFSLRLFLASLADICR